MTTASPPEVYTLDQLVDRLGGVPLRRIRCRPAPGTATDDDVVTVRTREQRLCELVDGVLVEKPMGLPESILAGALLAALRAFVIPRNRGVVIGEAGMMRLVAQRVRIPDVAFASWDRFPQGRVTDEPVPSLVPDLAVGVLSAANTEAEMERKRHEYFDAGVRLVWEVNWMRRTVTVYQSADDRSMLAEDDALDGADVLPGFSLALHDLFAELDRKAGA